MKNTKIIGICVIFLTLVVTLSAVKINNAVYIPPPYDDPGNGGTPHNPPPPILDSMPSDITNKQILHELLLSLISTIILILNIILGGLFS